MPSESRLARTAFPAPTSPRRAELRADDPTAAEELIRSVYGRVRLSAPREAPLRVRLSRIDVGCFSATEVWLSAQADAWVTGHDELVVGTLVSGAVRVGHGAALGPGDVSLGNFPGADYYCHSADVHARAIHLPIALLVAAAGRPVREEGVHLRFPSSRPVDDMARARWHSASEYARDVLAQPGPPPTPLVIASVARLLAATALSVFPHVFEAEPDSEVSPGAGGSAVLRRAMAYIGEHHADADLTIADIALAARATPRTVQYVFRHHLDMTPMAYLRRVRLARAHEDLRRSDPASTTVSAIAARWGFLHPGRFASYYEQAYSRAPSATLHASSAAPR